MNDSPVIAKCDDCREGPFVLDVAGIRFDMKGMPFRDPRWVCHDCSRKLTEKLTARKFGGGRENGERPESKAEGGSPTGQHAAANPAAKYPCPKCGAESWWDVCSRCGFDAAAHAAPEPDHDWISPGIFDNCGYYCRIHEHECILPAGQHDGEAHKDGIGA